jgi:hypothetical protein
LPRDRPWISLRSRHPSRLERDREQFLKAKAHEGGGLALG